MKTSLLINSSQTLPPKYFITYCIISVQVHPSLQCHFVDILQLEAIERPFTFFP